MTPAAGPDHADEARSALLADLLEQVAGCFPRRETRRCCGQMVSGLLMELEDHNCWTIAEAIGHCGPAMTFGYIAALDLAATH